MQLFILLELLRTHPLFRTHQESLRQILMKIPTQHSGRNLDRCGYFRQIIGEQHPVFAEFIEKNQSYLQARFEALQKWQAKDSVHFIVYGDVSYPRAFYRMHSPPWCLTIKGQLPFPWMEAQGLGVVGSREPRQESLIWLEQQLPLFLQSRRVFTVSGGARGVDQRVHSLSLRYRTPTVVVLPSGIQEIYPASLKTWEEEILATGGCLLSEYPMEATMQKYFFSDRNRLIAALASVVLIVEARERSGTLITAQMAADFGRPVLILPGHPTDPHYRGSLDLLAEGGNMVRDAEDLGLIFQFESWSVESELCQ